MSGQIAHELALENELIPCLDIETHELLQQLVERVERVGSPDQSRVLRHTTESIEEIIFESEVEGVLYFLVRSRSQISIRSSLSPRELAIARLIAQGLPNKTIGTILDISPWTVATHIRRIFTKLDVTTRAAMVAKLADEYVS